MNPLQQFIDFRFLLLILSKKLLRLFAKVSALVRIVLSLHLLNLGAFGLKQPISRGFELLELALARLLLTAFLFHVTVSVDS